MEDQEPGEDDQPPTTNATKARCRPEAATNRSKAADQRFSRVTKRPSLPPDHQRTTTREKKPCPGDRDIRAARWTSDTAEPPQDPSPPGPKGSKNNQLWTRGARPKRKSQASAQRSGITPDCAADRHATASAHHRSFVTLRKESGARFSVWSMAGKQTILRSGWRWQCCRSRWRS